MACRQLGPKGEEPLVPREGGGEGLGDEEEEEEEELHYQRGGWLDDLKEDWVSEKKGGGIKAVEILNPPPGPFAGTSPVFLNFGQELNACSIRTVNLLLFRTLKASMLTRCKFNLKPHWENKSVAADGCYGCFLKLSHIKYSISLELKDQNAPKVDQQNKTAF